MISIFGDVHAVDKEPRHSAQVDFLRWVLEECGNHPVIFSGDFWDKPYVHWEKSYSKMLDILLQFKEVHMIAGNHELKGTKGNMLTPLKGKWPNLHIYTEPEETTIDGSSFLMLPYLYDVPKMIETYSSLQWSGDYVVCHVSPPGKNYGSEEIDFDKNIKAKRIFYGHIHTPEDWGHHSIIGVPNTTRQGEQGFHKRYFTIEGGKIESKPAKVFYDIADIEFDSDTPVSDLNPFWEYNIINSPSVKEAMRKFRGANIHNVSVIQNIVKKSLDSSPLTHSSILEDFEEFLETEKVSEKVASTCKTYLIKT